MLMAAQGLAAEAAAPSTQATVSIVTGLSAGDILNIRAKAAPFGPVLGRLPNGSSLKNFGCSTVNGYNWCQVQEIGDPTVSGWAPERYLRQASADEIPPELAASVAEGTPPAEPNPIEPPIATTAEEQPPAPIAAAVPEAVAVAPPAEPSAPQAETVQAPSAVPVPEPLEQQAATPPAETAEPIALEKPRTAVTEWDKIALAGRALIVGRANAATAPQTKAETAETIAAPAAVQPMPPLATSDEQRQDRTVPTVPPVDLNARLGGVPAQTVDLDAQQKSAATIGQTASEDAYALAFAALENPQAEMSETLPVPVEEPLAGDVAAAPPADGAPLPSPRPGSLDAPILDMQAVAQTQPPAVATPLSALAAQQPFEVTGDIPCARYVGQPMTRCSTAVARTGGDTADITVAWPDGGTRIIHFRGGKPDSSNSRSDFRFSREGALNLIRIGVSERFEIVDALPFGD